MACRPFASIFSKREVDGWSDADDFRVYGRNVFAETEACAYLRISGWPRGNNHANPLRALHHVRICDDVAFGIDDYAGTQAAFAANQTGLTFVFGLDRAIAGDLDLNDGRRHARGEFFKRVIELREQICAAVGGG